MWSKHEHLKASGRAASYFLIVAWLTAVVAWLLIAFVEVESVIGTGPVLVVLGLTAGIISLVGKFWWGAAVSASYIFISVLFVVLVNVFSWSPSDAELPFTVMGAGFLLLVTPMSCVAWWFRPARRLRGQCLNCGYTLYGLVSQTCPECGLAFDPRTLIVPGPPSFQPHGQYQEPAAAHGYQQPYGLSSGQPPQQPYGQPSHVQAPPQINGQPQPPVVQAPQQPYGQYPQQPYIQSSPPPSFQYPANDPRSWQPPQPPKPIEPPVYGDGDDTT